MKTGIKSPESEMLSATNPDKLTNLGITEDICRGADQYTLEEIRHQVRRIEKSVQTKEFHYMTRVIRSLSTIRKKLNVDVLRSLVQGYFPNPSPQKTFFMDFLPEAMDTDYPLPLFRPRSGKTNVPMLPEVEVYLHLLLVLFLLDQNHLEEAVRCSNLLMESLKSVNRRSMSLIASRCYFYHSRAYELVGRLEAVRTFFHSCLSTATLRASYDVQAVLINLLLRNYIHYKLYEQAHKLVSRVVFPENSSNNERARYLYYLGTIKAIQLDYSAAHDHLVSALRKAPQNTAIGFKQSLHKWNTVVELLLGEQPDRSVFRKAHFKVALQPYFQLTQAIHAGDLGQFNEVIRNHGQSFSFDGTYNLIIRLRHNVIKTGVRRISLSYSRISLADVAKKLQLDSIEDAEYIVAKAICDGVIDAVINHEKGYVTTNETLDLYSTREPFNQFHQRIKFCLSIHNQAIKAMRYPPKKYTKDAEFNEERREREKQELENVKELSEDDFDGFP